MTITEHATATTLQLLSSSVLVDGELQQGIVTVERGIVTAVLTREFLPEEPPEPGSDTRVLDVGDAAVAPAPLDIHFHGAGGVVVPPAGGGAELDAAIEQLCDDAAWAYPGTPTSYDYLATLPAHDLPEYGAQGEDPLVAHVAAAARAAQESSRCRGLRLEGTFLNEARRGVWPLGMFRLPDVGLLEAMVDAARDGRRPLRIVDVAPELPGAIPFIERARELGVVVSLAHTDATYEEAMRAIDAGATLATHLFNAMRPFHHRDPGVVAAVLSDPRVHLELICDGEHVAPGAIALAGAAAAERLVAISDASPFAGVPAGEYDWLGKRIVSDGDRLRDADGALAGASQLLTSAERVLMGGGLTRAEALLAIAARPLQVLDPERTPGLEPGDRVWVSPVAP